MSILLWVLIWELIYSRAYGKHCCVGGILKWCMYGLCPPWSCVLVMWGRKAEIQWNGQRWRKMWVQRWGRYVHSSPLKRRLCRIWPWKDGARTFDLMDAILRNSGGRKKKNTVDVKWTDWCEIGLEKEFRPGHWRIWCLI